MGTDTTDRGHVREPTVAELRAFVAVAEELHFRRAAARLGMAPPPLSQTIRRLEDKVGSVLLERTPRTVRLTEAGEELLPRARDILQRMAEAQLAVRGARTLDHRGPFTVGIMSNGFAELTGPILQAFAQAHPRARLRLVEVTSEPARGCSWAPSTRPWCVPRSSTARTRSSRATWSWWRRALPSSPGATA